MTLAMRSRRLSALVLSGVAMTAMLASCAGGEVPAVGDSVSAEPAPTEQSRDSAREVEPSIADSQPAITDRTGGHDRGDIATLLAARTSAPAADGVERVVLEFDGDSVPRYEIAYLDPPFVQCGSGHAVDVSGEAVLQLRLRGTRAHAERADQLLATVTERDRKLGQPLLRQLILTCDFEGEVEWLLGLASRIPFRIQELHSPARLVVELLPAR